MPGWGFAVAFWLLGMVMAGALLLDQNPQATVRKMMMSMALWPISIALAVLISFTSRRTKE